MGHDLIADQFFNDPKIAEAKKLIMETLARHQNSIKGIKAADPALAQSFEETLKQFGELRGGGLFLPYLSSGFGSGAYVELADGSVKLDMITGIGVHVMGHSHPAVIEAGLDAAVSDTVMQGNLQQSIDSVGLSDLIVSQARKNGGDIAHLTLTTSGAMANENALKMAFQKNAPADRILAFKDCFCGRTLLMAAITDRAKYRDGLPQAASVDYVPFYDATRPEESTAEAVAILEEHLARHPGKYAAMMMELVQGEGGFYPGTRDFFVALIEVLKKHDIAVMFDEIQTVGRTTELFAYQHFGLDEYADIVSFGKMTQVCGTLYTEAYKPRPGLISQTFTGSTWAIKSAEVIINHLIDGGHFGIDGENMKLHAYFQSKLEGIAGEIPGAVNGPFGIGGMVAFTPFDGSAETAMAVMRKMYEHGVICFITGSSPVRVRFLLPLGTVTHADIDVACNVLMRVLVEVNS